MKHLDIDSLTPEEKDALLRDIIGAVYVEECRVTGMHDPTHTPRHVCRLQLGDLAIRVLGTLGIDLLTPSDSGTVPKSEYNKIPRVENVMWDKYRRDKLDAARTTHLKTDPNTSEYERTVLRYRENAWNVFIHDVWQKHGYVMSLQFVDGRDIYNREVPSDWDPADPWNTLPEQYVHPEFRQWLEGKKSKKEPTS